MTYQFIHIETYARKASTKQKPTKVRQKKTEAKRDVCGIIDEAIRRDGNCPHVEKPESPRFIIGNMQTMENMEAEIEANISAHHAKHGGRKLRADAHVLLAGIVSVERKWLDENPDLYEKWEADSVQYLQRKYGKNLRCVLMHNDEPHPHLHFYVYSEEQIDAKELHDGQKAMRQHQSMTKEAVIAHADAMRAFQTDYYQQVAHGVGLTRIGPARERLSRKDWKQSKRVELERVRLTKAADDATQDILNNAAQEEKRAADARRDAERTKARTETERSLMMLNAWAISKAQKKEGRYLKWWEDKNRQKEKAQEKWDADLKARAQDLDELTGGLAQAPAHKITTWNTPSADEQRMLDFLAKNPQLAALMKEAQANDSVADVLAGIQKDMESPGMHVVDSGEDWEAKLRESDKPKARANSSSLGYGYGS